MHGRYNMQPFLPWVVHTLFILVHIFRSWLNPGDFSFTQSMILFSDMNVFGVIFDCLVQSLGYRIDFEAMMLYNFTVFSNQSVLSAQICLWGMIHRRQSLSNSRPDSSGYHADCWEGNRIFLFWLHWMWVTEVFAQYC